jgi:hypothetical protein
VNGHGLINLTLDRTPWRAFVNMVINLRDLEKAVQKGKALPVTGRGGYGCATLRLPHFLQNRLTDGDEVVSLTRRPLFTPLPGRFLVLISVRG